MQDCIDTKGNSELKYLGFILKKLGENTNKARKAISVLTL